MEGDHRAVVLRLALVAQHQRVAVDDPGRGREEPGHPAQPRLERAGAGRRRGARGRRRRCRGRPGRCPRARPPAPASVATMILPSRRCGTPCAAAVGVEHRLAGDAEPRLGRALRIVDAGVDDLGVARAGVAADQPLLLEHHHLAPGPRQRPGDGEPDHARAHHHALRPIHARSPPGGLPLLWRGFRQASNRLAGGGGRPPFHSAFKPRRARSRSGTPCVHRPPNRPPPARARCPPRSGARPGPGCRAPRGKPRGRCAAFPPPPRAAASRSCASSRRAIRPGRSRSSAGRGGSRPDRRSSPRRRRS